MIQTSIAKFFLLSQALSLMLGINDGFILKYDNIREKRDLMTLLSGSDSLVSASDVNPLDVIPIPLKMNITGDQNNYFEEEDQQVDTDDDDEEILGQLGPVESDINFDNFDQKLNNLKLMYETAVSNLRTETIGAQTYIQKKTSLAEQHLENILKSVELMVNNRVDLSFHSIETKMNEAQKLLNALNGLILKNLESKLKLMEGDLFAQVKKEKSELENKMNQFNEKVEILSDKLTQLVTGRYNANKMSLNETDSVNETTVEPSTTTAPLSTSITSESTSENILTESVADEQSELDEHEETNENLENAVAEENVEVDEESLDDNEESSAENEVVLNAWRKPAFHFDYPEYEEYLVPSSEPMVDYYDDVHPVHYEYQIDYNYY